MDFETTKQFTLNVTATDRGTPKALQSWMKIDIYLADVNDHSPRFDKRVYTASVYENEKEGTFVIKVGVRRV